jgi:ribosome-associated translation inhibitor RaiA
MRLEIHARNLPLEPNLVDFVERRVRSAVGRLGRRLRRVVVQLSDLNGPRGGEDIRCRVQAHFTAARPLVVESVRSGPYLAVSMATDRLGRTAVRRLQRQRARRRRLAPVRLG